MRPFETMLNLKTALITVLLISCMLILGQSICYANQDNILSTTKCGDISSDETWNPAGSPYLITCTVTIQSGVTVTIEAGVVVDFQGPYDLEVNGTIVARGTSDEKIQFTTSGTILAPGDWGSIIFNDTGTDATYDVGGNYLSGCILEYCIIEYGGPAIFCDASSPFIHNNIIRNSASADNGGGIKLENSSNPLVKKNEIDSCTCSNRGGGISVYYSSGSFIENTISGCFAPTTGGGIELDHPSSEVIGNIFEDNSTNGNGGGLHISYDTGGNSIIKENIFRHNNAVQGAAAYFRRASSPFIGNVVRENTASSEGGGIACYWSSSPQLYLCDISGNSGSRGAAVYLYRNCQPSMTYCTLANNTASTGDGHAILLDNYMGTDTSKLAACNNNNITREAGGILLYQNNANDFTAENNWWGVTTSGEIEDLIYHKVDSTAKGEVDYSPFLNNPDPDAPPPPPTGLAAEKIGTTINLTWDALDLSDLVGYKVYYDNDQSGPPYNGNDANEGNSPFDAGNVTNTSLTGIDAGLMYYLAITAYDSDLNESYYSEEASSIITPTPTATPTITPTFVYTPVCGDISVNTTWTSGNTYRVTCDVNVLAGVTLTIEDGVRVEFEEDNSLGIFGTLHAIGSTAKSYITFTSANESPARGDWGSISFDDSSTDAVFDGYGNYISGCILENCIIEYGGPGIACNNSSPYIHLNIIRYNQSDLSGGIALTGASPVIEGNEFTNNNGVDGGGILCLNSSQPEIIENDFIANSTSSTGGGVSVNSSNPQISDNLFSENDSASGGAIYLYSSSPDISGNDFMYNIAYNYGGGIYCYFYSSPNIINNEIIECTSYFGGGGIYCKDHSSPYIFNNSIWGNNTFSIGGSIGCETSSDPIIVFNRIIKNSTTSVLSNSGGGGIYCLSSDPQVYHNQIWDNWVLGSGGGIFAQDSSALITHNDISGNSAGYFGGGIYAWLYSNLTVKYDTFAYNTAQAAQGQDIQLMAGATDNTDLADFHNNNFINQAGEIKLYNGTPNSFSGTDNWWDTVNSGEIEGMIFHYTDDNARGLVTYNPYLLTADATAPPPPPTGFTAGSLEGNIYCNWNNVSISDRFGYFLYYNTSSGYPYEGTGANEGDSPVNVGNVTDFVLTGLAAKETFYLSARIYDLNNALSYYSLEAIPSPLPSWTPTDTPTVSPTASPTSIPTDTPTPTPSLTPTDTPTISATPTDTPTPTISQTPTQTPTVTPTSISGPPLIDITAFLEGYYNSTTQTQVATTIEFELRTGTDPGTATTIVYDSNSALDTSGQTGPILLDGLAEDDYFVVLGHYNHLDVITLNKLSFVENNTTIVNISETGSPDFVHIFGEDAMKQENDGSLSMKSGNCQNDQFVNVSDFLVWRLANGSSPGAGNWDEWADLDGNLLVNISDFFYWRINNGSSTYVP